MKYSRDKYMLAVCAVIFVVSCSVLIGIWLMYKKGSDEYDGLKSYVEKSTEQPDGTGEDDTEKSSESAPDIDFDGLRAINPDIVAWIHCEELGVDYPVVRGRIMNIT